MRINQLKLQNVGVFEDQKIEFKPKVNEDKAEIHILTGVNGSGKSTILYALASAFTNTNKLLQRRFRYEDERSSVEISCRNSSENLLSRQLSYDKNKNFRYLKSDTLLNLYVSNASVNLQDVQSKEFDFAAFSYTGSRTISATSIQAIQELATNPLANSLNFQTPVDTKQLIQWIANTQAKIAFAKQDNKLERAAYYQSSIMRIEDAITEIVGYPIEFGFTYEPLNVHVKASGVELEFDLLPDGLKSIISWLADLLMRLDRMKWVGDVEVLDRNFILFLDEIEIHLHPAWQRKILPVIQNLFKNAQIFIATHSPFVVASVGEAWVYRFDVVDGQSHLVAVEESKAGSSYVTVLDETFGIDEFFDPVTENEFDEFERLKKEVLNGNNNVLPELTKVAERLSKKSVEVQDIVGRELRQLQRLTPEELPMMKFPRPTRPNFLAENYKAWGRDYKDKRDANPSAPFRWKSYLGKRVNDHILNVFDTLAEHCAFCDGYPLGRSARQTIEHFRPKSKYPRLAYVWANLFPCCDQCQSSKQEKFDRMLLKPDVASYAFESYFLLNYKTGEIDVNPQASEHDQTRARLTIELYGLNGYNRPKSRLLEYRKYRKLVDNDEFTLNDFSYRFFLI